MAGKLDNYALGQGGVNVNKTPAQIKPDEARQLQNAILDTDKAVGGLRKRGGLQRFNSAAINAGANVLGGIGVPLPSPSVTRTYYAGIHTTNTWATSTNGTSWTAGTTPSIRPAIQTKRDIAGATNATISNVRTPTGFGRKLWYPSDDYTVGTSDPKIRFYDGTDEYDISEIPTSPVDGDQATYITGWTLHDGEQYVACYDPGAATGPTSRGRVFHLDHKTGALTQIGEEFGSTGVTGGLPINIVSFMGQLFVALEGISGVSTRKIVRIRPFVETAWTTDVNTATKGYAQSMAVFKGNLYVGCGETVGADPEIMKRTPAGAYTSVKSETGGGTHGVRFFSNVFVFDGTLYAHYYQSTTVSKIVKSTDGSAWSDDFDIAGTLGAANWFPGSFQIEPGGGAVQATVIASGLGTGHILRKTSGGSWGSVSSGNYTGHLGMVEVQA